MKYSQSSILMVLILLVLGIVSLTLPVNADTNQTVLMLDVSGNNKVPVEKILGAISATRIGEPLNTQSVQSDVNAIMGLGYFADVQVKMDKFMNGVKLTFAVIENPIFKEIRISGLTKVTPQELESKFTQKSGDVFNTATFRSDLDKAKKYCRESKGLFVELVKTDLSDDGVLSLQLVELKVGKITIKGLEKTKEFVVRRELSVKEGDIFDSKVLQEDYFKLGRLRLFDGIEFKPEPSETPNALDLVIEVKEASTGSFQIGASYSENTQEMGGLLAYTEDNLMGLGQSVSLNLDYSKSGKDASFNFYDPWLNDKQTSFSMSLWNSDSTMTTTMNSWQNVNTLSADPKQYDLDLVRTGLAFSFGRPITNDTRASLKFSFEKNAIGKITTTDFVPDPITGQPTLQTQTVEKTHNSDPKHPYEFWDDALALELVKNKMQYGDGRFFVTGGYQLSGSYSVAGQYLGGEYDYQKLLLEGKWFHSLTRNLVIGTRLQGVTLNGEYPDYDQLYLGGMFRLRGYEDKRYHDSSTLELIGDKYILSNTELRYLLPSNKSLELVGFYDVGQIIDSESKTLKYDYGVGLRYNVPMLGLIRLDQAWNGDGGGRLVISIGETF